MFPMLQTVMRNLVSGPATRLQPRSPFPGVRGQIDVEADKCILCGMCQRKCPADALVVNRAERTWTLNPYRCIVCGLCSEACPKKCIPINPSSRVSAADKEQLVRTIPLPAAVPAAKMPDKPSDNTPDKIPAAG